MPNVFKAICNGKVPLVVIKKLETPKYVDNLDSNSRSNSPLLVIHFLSQACFKMASNSWIGGRKDCVTFIMGELAIAFRCQITNINCLLLVTNYYFCEMTNTIQQALAHLKAGKTILYPTDTIWGLGCDDTNAKAVSEIYALKKRVESKALICLVSSLEMLKTYIE